jgi:hypothetical protein
VDWWGVGVLALCLLVIVGAVATCRPLILAAIAGTVGKVGR